VKSTPARGLAVFLSVQSPPIETSVLTGHSRWLRAHQQQLPHPPGRSLQLTTTCACNSRPRTDNAQDLRVKYPDIRRVAKPRPDAAIVAFCANIATKRAGT